MDKSKRVLSLVPVSRPTAFDDPNFVLLPSRRVHRRPLYQPLVPLGASPTTPLLADREVVLRPLSTNSLSNQSSTILPVTSAERLATMLGFFEPIDKHKKCLAVLEAIAAQSRIGRFISSTTLSRQLGLSRGSTLNHLGTLLRRGIIIKKGRHYQLRGGSVEASVALLEHDVSNWFSEMKNHARAWDDALQPVSSD